MRTGELEVRTKAAKSGAAEDVRRELRERGTKWIKSAERMTRNLREPQAETDLVGGLKEMSNTV